MSDASPEVRERYIGSLLGMAIGDALALPVRDLGTAEAIERYGHIAGYVDTLDEAGNVSVAAGQFSDHTELAMCLVESLVTSNGFIDPEIAGYRFVQLLRSEHAHLLSPLTLEALQRADDTDEFQNGLSGDGEHEPGPALRVIPVALIHALSEFNPEMFVREVLRSVLITHSHPDVVNGALAVAYALRLVIRREVVPEMLIGEVLAFIDEDEVARTLRRAQQLLEQRYEFDPGAPALEIFKDASPLAGAIAVGLYLFSQFPEEFETSVLLAANSGAPLSDAAAFVGALVGAHTGGSTLPEALVEGLEGRMYVLMAAPTLFRAAQMRAGLFLHLR